MKESSTTAIKAIWLSFIVLGNTKTIYYALIAPWMTAIPDGALERAVIRLNGEGTFPQIRVDKGDKLMVHLQEDLKNVSPSLHTFAHRGLHSHRVYQHACLFLYPRTARLAR